jgi:hypothetical protein
MFFRVSRYHPNVGRDLVSRRLISAGGTQGASLPKEIPGTGPSVPDGKG